MDGTEGQQLDPPYQLGSLPAPSVHGGLADSFLLIHGHSLSSSHPSSGEREGLGAMEMPHLSLCRVKVSSFLSLYLKRALGMYLRVKIHGLVQFQPPEEGMSHHTQLGEVHTSPDLSHSLSSSLPGCLGHRQTLASSMEHLRTVLPHSWHYLPTSG